MEILSFAEAEVPPPLQAQVFALIEQAWPPGELTEDEDPTRGDMGHDPALHPLSMLLIEHEVVLASLAILSKDFIHEGQCYAASGLSTVVTDRTQRGKGYGRRLVSAARSHISQSEADLGIFTCDRPLQTFYESAGWTTLVDTVIIGGTQEAPFPSDQFDKVAMASFFSARAIREADTFNHCRIELFPGHRDKLW